MSTVHITQPILLADPVTGLITGFKNAKNQDQALPTSGGSTPVATVAFSTAIPLDTANNGKRSDRTTIGSALALTIAAGAIDQGNYTWTAVADGVHAVDLSAFSIVSRSADFPTGSSFVGTAGHLYAFYFVAVQSGASTVVLLTVADIATTVSPPVFSAQSAPAGMVGIAYSYTFVASGSPTYALGTGALPAGLSLSSGGVLSGTPTTAAAYTFTVTATNAGGTVSSTSQSVTIAPAASGSLSVALVTPLTVENLTSGLWLDYQAYAVNAFNDVHKNVTPIIAGPTPGGAATRGSGGSGGTAASWTDATGTGSNQPSATLNEAGVWTCTGAPGELAWTIPVGVTSVKVRLRSSQYIDTTGVPTITAVLSDGSATPLSFSPTYTPGNTPQADEFEYEFTFNAASPGQSLTIKHKLASIGTFAQIYCRFIAGPK